LTGQWRATEPSPRARLDQLRFQLEINRLYGRLYAAALRMTRDPDDADDVAAEAVARAWCCLGELREWARFEGWLFRILHTRFIGYLRRRRCREARERSLSALPQERAETVPHEGLGVDLLRALAALPPAHRRVLLMVALQGYTYQEAAARLGLPVGTVRSRLSRARHRLQLALIDYHRRCPPPEFPQARLGVAWARGWMTGWTPDPTGSGRLRRPPRRYNGPSRMQPNRSAHAPQRHRTRPGLAG